MQYWQVIGLSTSENYDAALMKWLSLFNQKNKNNILISFLYAL